MSRQRHKIKTSLDQWLMVMPLALPEDADKQMPRVRG